MKEQSKQLYDGKVFGPEVWSQFLAGQAPMMQSMMGSYMDQSKHMFMQMQEQMQNQTRSMFGNAFPFPGGGVQAPSTDKSTK
jgi:polyhydroxyalkanoate synthesis regulator protein